MGLFSRIKAFKDVITFIVRHPLCKNHKLKSILYFARFQLATRLFAGSFIFDWVEKARFAVSHGETMLTGNVYCGLYEFEDMAFALHFSRPGDCFVDVGANVGPYSILLGAVNKCTGYSFEPVPDIYSKLKENIRLNKLESMIKCMPMGVGEEKGTLLFTCDLNAINHVVTPELETKDDVKTISVDVCRLDDILKEDNPVILKIDVEGFEEAVINGASETLNKQSLKCVIVEMNDSGSKYGYQGRTILDKMTAFGFTAFTYEPFSRELIRLNNENHKIGRNTIFIRDLDFVNERLKTARKFTIKGYVL